MEASAQFGFLGTTGNAQSNSIGAGGEATWRPDPWIYPLRELDAWRYEQVAALNVAMNAILALKVSHTIRYSAEPPPGFEKTDTITAVSLVARIKRP